MKTLTLKAKKIFLLAAILLCSASAMAQSGSNRTLNGDTEKNYYIYFGETEPTATNLASMTNAQYYQSFNTLPSWTSSNPASFTATISCDWCWVVAPQECGTLKVIDTNGFDQGMITEEPIVVNNITYNKYVIAISKNMTYYLFFEEYWYYWGTEEISLAELQTKGKRTSTPITKITNTLDLLHGDYAYFIYPKSWGKATLLDNDGDGVGMDPYDEWYTKSDIKEDYFIYSGGSGMMKGVDINISYSSPYYWYVGTELPTVSNISSMGNAANQPPTSFMSTTTSDNGDNCYFVYPKEWGTVAICQDEERTDVSAFEYFNTIYEQFPQYFTGSEFEGISELVNNYHIWRNDNSLEKPMIYYLKWDDQPTQPTYKYYYGSEEDINLSKLNSVGISVNEPLTTITQTVEPNPNAYIYFIYPKSWGIATILDSDGDGVGLYDFTEFYQYDDVKENYYIYTSKADKSLGSIFTITYTQPYYWYVGTTLLTSANISTLGTPATTPPSQMQSPTYNDEGNWAYFIYPKSWGTVKMYEDAACTEEATWTLQNELLSSYTDLTNDYNIHRARNQFGDIPVTLYLKWDDQPTTQYYWYVGNANDPMPTTISPIVTDSTSVGWRLIGSTLTNGQQIWDETNDIQISTESKVYQRIIINAENVNLKFYDSFGTELEGFVSEPIVQNGWTTFTTTSKSKTFSVITKIELSETNPEQPVTITANDLTITYGEDIPILTYSVDGATLNGTPKLSTTATKESPIGVYPIKVEQGTVTNTMVTYVDGTLTILQNNEDLTSRVGISQQDWNAGGMIPDWAGTVVITRDGRETPLAERYAEPATVTGTVLEQTVTGLKNGTYEVTLFANAFYTDGRGFTSDITDGQNDVVYVFANDTKKYVTAHIGTGVTNHGEYTLTCSVIDGNLHLGMTAEREGTNWHSIQIKSLDYVSDEEQPVTITANDLTITYGEDIPTLTYNVDGATLNGTPKLSTTATKESPIGVYPIKVEQGTVTNTMVIYVDGTLTILQNTNDLTSRVGISQQDWNAGGMIPDWAGTVVITRDGRETPLAERYAEPATVTGMVLEQTVTGLKNGTYDVTLFANAFYTDGRGFTSDITDGQNDVVYVFANDTKKYVTAHIGTSVTNHGEYTLTCYVIDGNLHLGMTAEREGTNWHSIQIKSLDYVSDDIPSDIKDRLMNREEMNNVIYDLQGRRVTNPSKGIYIIGGKKMVK